MRETTEEMLRRANGDLSSSSISSHSWCHLSRPTYSRGREGRGSRTGFGDGVKSIHHWVLMTAGFHLADNGVSGGKLSLTERAPPVLMR